MATKVARGTSKGVHGESSKQHIVSSSNQSLPRLPPQTHSSNHVGLNAQVSNSSRPIHISLPANLLNQRQSSSTPLHTPTHLTPLPLLPLSAPQIATLRGNLKRRRSSFPPATTPGSSAGGHPWVIGGTPNGKTVELVGEVASSGFGNEISGMAWTPEWDGLLDFDIQPQQRGPLRQDSAPTVIERSAVSPKQTFPLPMARAKSEPGEATEPHLASLRGGNALPMAPTLSPGRIAQYGSDLAWKTILGSVVEVEGVGEVGVCRVLQEVWKRGGGEVVTSQCLWPSIIMSLSLLPSSANSSSGVRIPTPSAHASMALQELYNLTLRHWEPSIFSGLLATYSATPSSAPTQSFAFPGTATPTYGPSTPTKELDLSQWTNLTPGLGDLSTLFGGSSGHTPRASISNPSNLSQFEWHADFEPREAPRPGTADSIRGIDEILASMEEGNEANEREIQQAAAEAQATPSSSSQQLVDLPHLSKTRSEIAYQFPTPETETDTDSRDHRRSQSSVADSYKTSNQFSPESMSSPFVTASSGTNSVISKDLNTKPEIQSRPSQSCRAAHPMNIMMPTDAFVPPPPMCMFFSPSFRDLEKGKVGVWKGDLELKGIGGGTFSVLIVGEETSGHLWQSHSWPAAVSHPVVDSPESFTSSFTSKMIPVAYLAREGYTPVAMGMVLCNDPQIEKYVAMVQSLHAEGVAFHLPNPGNLPIVLLPAKFDPADPLQRMGIAYMCKAGMPLPQVAQPIPATLASAASSTEKTAAEEPKKKKRRQSAPAKPITGLPGHKRRSSTTMRGPRSGSKEGKVEEAVILEEED